MAVPTSGFSLEDVRIELGLSSPTSLSACIAAAGKTGVWNKLSDFAGYSNAYCSVDKTAISFPETLSTTTVNVSSNTSWSVSSNQSWLTFSGATGAGNDTFNITADTNQGVLDRTGTISITWSGGTINIEVTQAGSQIKV